MNKPTTLRRLLLVPPGLRTSFITPRIQSSRLSLAVFPTNVSPRSYSSIPSITSPSFWKSMIPKPFRKTSASSPVVKKAQTKEWNPATFFIVIFLLIGSMSIQMIALKNEFAAFSRRADAKLGLLREIIGRIQNGEDVDVEGLLGTGDEKREKEWEEVLREIEEEDQAWERSRKPKPQHGKNLEQSKAPLDSQTDKDITKIKEESEKNDSPPGFY